MRIINEADLAKKIEFRLQRVNREILSSRQQPPVRTSPRDPEEQKILDELCIRSWKCLKAKGSFGSVIEILSMAI